MSDYYPATRHRDSLFKRIGYLIAACVFIVLGIIGLIMPVLPGIIFLLIAAVILARVSRRVDRWVKKHHFTRSTQTRVELISRLSWLDKARISFWYTGAALVNLCAMAGNGVMRLKSAISQGN